MVWSTHAAKIYLSPSTGTFIENCPFAIDIMGDMQDASATTTDLSLTYAPNTLVVHTFEPWQLFPDMFPPRQLDKRIDIIGMKYPWVVTGTGKMGTLIISSNKNVSDAVLNFRINGYGKNQTTDTNLSLSGFDQLTEVENGYYTFKKWECDNPYKDLLNVKIDNKKIASWVQETVTKINEKLAVEESKKNHGSAFIELVKSHTWYSIGLIIVVLIIIIYLYVKHKKNEIK